MPVTYDAAGLEQPRDHLGDLRRLAGTTHRDAVGHPIRSVGHAGYRVDFRTDDARGDAVDPDPVGRQFFREPDSQCIDGRLARRVVHILAGAAEGCGGRREVHDRTASGERAGGHPGAEQRAGDVDVDDPPDVVGP